MSLLAKQTQRLHRWWLDHAESLFDAPLQMHYSGLDPMAHYRIRVV